MPLTFSQASSLFKNDKFNELCSTSTGLRFLKLRALNRTECLERLFQVADLEKPDVGSRELFEAAYSANISLELIESCAREIYAEERKIRCEAEADLVNQLYKVQEFNWGGLHQNSLEKTIVDNYIKRITKYAGLCEAIEGELLTSLRGYVICSWYNHWTSIIIEDLFKDHEKVLPAVGLIKKIDFFIGEVPFDLKVTYLPEGYLSESRRNAKKRPELTLLKQAARKHKLPIPSDLAASGLLQDLWAKVDDHPAKECKDLIAELKAFRSDLIDEIAHDPAVLLKWLYENQGVARFDASNRLFVILVDQENYFDSWKLKRAKALMESKIHEYLDGCAEKPGRPVSFTWEGVSYSTIADLLLIRSS